MKLLALPLLSVLAIVLVSGCTKTDTSNPWDNSSAQRSAGTSNTNYSAAESNSQIQSQANVKVCNENWSCFDWTLCSSQNTQTRECDDANSCGTTKNKPPTSRACTYTPTLDKFGLKAALDDADCGAWGGSQASMILYENNTVTIEQTGDIAASSDYGSKSEYACLIKKANAAITYLNSVSIKPNNIIFKDILTCYSGDCKIVGKTITYCYTDGDIGCFNSVSYYTDLSWSDAQGISNLGMSYSVWLGKMSLTETQDSSATSSDSQQTQTNTANTPASQNSCAPNWQCSDWSVCSSSGSQTRTCSDSNSCGTTSGKPSLSQACSPPGLQDPDLLVVKGTDLPQNWTITGSGYTGFTPYMWSANGLVDGVKFMVDSSVGIKLVDIKVAKYNSYATALTNYNAFVENKSSQFDTGGVSSQCLGYYKDATETEGLVEMICVKNKMIFDVQANVYGSDYVEIATQFANIVSGNIA
jgi:hypothetical protein